MKVSEFLTNPSTTQESQENTPSGNITIPDINFSINCNFRIYLDPETKTMLTYAISLLEAHKQPFDVQHRSIEKAAVQLGDLPEDEPLELTPNVPEVDVKDEEPEKYGHIVYGDDSSWNHIERFRNLRWKEDGKNILLKYSSANITTTWEKVEELSRLPADKLNQAVQNMSSTNNGKSAIRTFLTCLKEGLVKRPVLSADPDAELDKSFSEFQVEEDPDAFARPFVTPHFSTRPDYENGGKIEGTLEG